MDEYLEWDILFKEVLYFFLSPGPLSRGYGRRIFGILREKTMGDKVNIHNDNNQIYSSCRFRLLVEWLLYF